MCDVPVVPAPQGVGQLNTDDGCPAPIKIGVLGRFRGEEPNLLQNILQECGAAVEVRADNPDVVIVSLDAVDDIHLGITPPYNPEVLLHAVAAARRGTPLLIFGRFDCFTEEYQGEYRQSFCRLLEAVGLPQPIGLEMESSALLCVKPRTMRPVAAEQLRQTHVENVREHNAHVIASSILRLLHERLT